MAARWFARVIEVAAKEAGLNPPPRIELVTATRDKATRADPIRALYLQHKVHHVGNLFELEREMSTWVPDGKHKSPNRLDSLVWGVTWLAGLNKHKPRYGRDYSLDFVSNR